MPKDQLVFMMTFSHKCLFYILAGIVFVSCAKRETIQFEVLKGSQNYIYVDSSLFKFDVPPFVISIYDNEFLVSFAEPISDQLRKLIIAEFKLSDENFVDEKTLFSRKVFKPERTKITLNEKPIQPIAVFKDGITVFSCSVTDIKPKILALSVNIPVGKNRDLFQGRFKSKRASQLENLRFGLMIDDDENQNPVIWVKIPEFFIMFLIGLLESDMSKLFALNEELTTIKLGESVFFAKNEGGLVTFTTHKDINFDIQDVQFYLELDSERLEANTAKFKNTFERLKRRGEAMFPKQDVERVSKYAENFVKVKKAKLAVTFNPDDKDNPIDFSKSSCALGF